MTYAQVKEIERKNKQRFLTVNPNLTEGSGIYFLSREENGIKYAYVGQAKHILTRLAQHLVGYQHIDISLKKRGLYNESNPLGWKVHFFSYPIEELDKMEQSYIRASANKGYQLYNHTTGSQGKGKQALGEGKSPKGYREGVAQGYKNARKFIAHLFEKNLEVQIKGKFTQNKAKAYQKFLDFITLEEEKEEDVTE